MENNTKKCNKCLIIFPIDFYEKNGEYHRNICKSCRLKQINEARDKKKSSDKIVVTEKECIKCHAVKLVENFNKSSVSKDNFSSYCNECYKIKRKNRIVNNINISLNEKTCLICHTIKSIDNFKKTKRSTDGYFNKCVSCLKPTTWNKEKQKESEKKYVANNKEKIKIKWKKDGAKINRRLRNAINHSISGSLRSQKNYKSNNVEILVTVRGNGYVFLLWFGF
jgi:hypothetical protein